MAPGEENGQVGKTLLEVRYLVESTLVGFNLLTLRAGGKGCDPENKGKDWP